MSVRYSRGAEKHDNSPAQCEAEDFAAFRQAILADRAIAKGRQWIASPFDMAPDDAKHRGSASMASAIGKPHRCSDCALPRRWIGADVDKGLDQESFYALATICGHYSGLIYTTASHTAEAPRCRIVLEVDLEAPRAELIAATGVIRARIDARMIEAGYPAPGWDTSCDRPEQPLYLPPVDSHAYVLDGAPLSLGELLANVATPTRAADPMPLPAGIVEGDAYAVAALASAARAVTSAQPGDLNRVLNLEAYSMGGFVGAGRLSRERVLETFDILTAGWDNQAKTRGTIRGAIVTGSAKPRLDGLPTPIEAPRLNPVSLDGVMEEDAGPWPHVVEGYFPRRVVTLLGGHGGVGKSMLALILAAHVAAGRPWGPLAVDRCRVVFLSFEDEGKVLRARLRRIVEAYDINPADVFANLVIFDGSDGETELALEQPNGGLEFTPMMGLVADAARGAGLLILDNASDTYGANENERRQVRRFVRRLAQEGKAYGSAVVLLAHVDKQAAKGGGKGNNYSGSTQWHNSVRSRLALVEADGLIELLHEKANYGPQAASVSLIRGEHGVLSPIPPEVARATRDAAAAILTQGDCADVLRVFEALLAHDMDIPTAETGQRTTYHVLSRAPEMPAHLKGTAGKERTKAAVMALEREGRIARETYKRDRKERERWTLAHFPPREAA